MKKKIIRYISGVLSVCVMAGAVAGVGYAKTLTDETADNEAVIEEAVIEEVANEETLNEEATVTTTAEEEEKLVIEDEVVYVFADAKGKVDKVKDSIWIENGNDEAMTGEKANLPLDVKVSYKLDGKNVEPDALTGKSGHVVIRVDFTNRQFEERIVNGENKKVYVPFVAASMGVFDSEKFENIKVSTGKVAFDGARYAVVGVAFPGLKEDIDLDLEKDELDDIEIPEYIEIEADVKDYEFSGLYLAVSNSIFNEMDVDTTDKMEELRDDIDKITEAMDALMDGSDELYKGLVKLNDGANKLSDGVIELANGLNEIDSNSDALANGAHEVFKSLLATASSEMKKSGISVGNLQIDSYGEVLDAVIAEGYTTGVAKDTVVSNVNANRGTIEERVTQAVRENVASQVEAGFRDQIADAIAAQYGVDKETVLANFGAQVDAVLASKAADIEAMTDAKMASSEVKAIIDSKVNETVDSTIDSYMGSEEVKTQISEGNKKIAELKESLDEYNRFYQGVLSYTDAVGKASEGANTLRNSMPELLNGINALKNGQSELSDGLKQFNEEGITKITDLVDNTLEGLLEKVNVMNEVSKNYKAYDSNGAAMKEGVKFIYKIG